MELGRGETRNAYTISAVKHNTKQTSRTGRGLQFSGRRHEGPAPAATAARRRNRLPAPLCHCAVRTGACGLQPYLRDLVPVQKRISGQPRQK
jgi:hypothetical protein